MPDSRVDWPYADKAWREFVFIRPLQAPATSIACADRPTRCCPVEDAAAGGPAARM